jgi:two-component sensor histidine kinase
MIEAFLTSLPMKPQPVIVRLGATTLIVVGLYLLQTFVEQRAEILGFFLLYPAIFFAGVTFDRGSGFYATGLSTALLLFDITRQESGSVPPPYWLALVLFVLIGILVASLSEALRHEWERAVSAEATKDLLLRELQHRTKNDLATAAAVLSLQARSQTNPAVVAALSTARSRLQVLSKAHEQFEPGLGSRTVAMKDFIESICGQLAEAMKEFCTVSVDVACDPVYLPIDRAIPIGLVVNELVTNAYKHGFSEAGTGKVMVHISGNASLSLMIEDNGKGCPQHAQEGVGSQLIKQLVMQLGGTLERTEANPGCRVTIHIPQP